MGGHEKGQASPVTALLVDHGHVDQCHLERPEATLPDELGGWGGEEHPDLGAEVAHMGEGHVGGRPD